MGLTFGRTAKIVSPTRPRDVEATPEVLIAISAPMRSMSASEMEVTCDL